MEFLVGEGKEAQDAKLRGKKDQGGGWEGQLLGQLWKEGGEYRS